MNSDQIEYVRDLGRDEIVGHRIVQILQFFEQGEGVCNFAFTFYCLDSGVVFTLPDPSAGEIGANKPPAATKPAKHPCLDQVLGQVIQEVCRPIAKSNLPDDCTYLVLGNGYVITDVIGSPEGIADEGLWVYPPEEIDTSHFVPLWPTSDRQADGGQVQSPPPADQPDV